VNAQIREAIRKMVENDFPEKSTSEKEALVEEYCSKVMVVEEGKITIRQSRGHFVIDMEGNDVDGVYCELG